MAALRVPGLGSLGIVGHLGGDADAARGLVTHPFQSSTSDTLARGGGGDIERVRTQGRVGDVDAARGLVTNPFHSATSDTLAYGGGDTERVCALGASLRLVFPARAFVSFHWASCAMIPSGSRCGRYRQSTAHGCSKKGCALPAARARRTLAPPHAAVRSKISTLPTTSHPLLAVFCLQVL